MKRKWQLPFAALQSASLPSSIDLPAFNSFLPQRGKVGGPKVADCADRLSVAGVLGRVLLGVLGGVDPPRSPHATPVAAVALQVLLHAPVLTLGKES